MPVSMSIDMLSLGLVQANGVLAYFTTLALFALGWQFRVFSPARVYDLFGEILAALNIFSLLFCLFLYFKVCSGSSLQLWPPTHNGRILQLEPEN